MLPCLRELKVGLVPYSPLGRGFLTGRMQQAPPGYSSFDPRLEDANFQRNLALVRVVEELAAELEATAGQVALAWLLAQGEDVVPIPGTRRVKWLDENAAALSLVLNADALARLERVAAGTAGARYSPELMQMTDN